MNAVATLTAPKAKPVFAKGSSRNSSEGARAMVSPKAITNHMAQKYGDSMGHANPPMKWWTIKKRA